MLPVLQVGPFALQLPAFILLIGVWLMLEVASRSADSRGLDGERVHTLLIMTLISGVIGARLGFILLNLGFYTAITPLLQMLGAAAALTPGTEIPLIGIIVAGVVLGSLAYRSKLPPITLMDSLAPAAAVLIAAVSLANLFSGRMYGTETNLFWGIPLGGTMRHPTQIMLFLAALATLGVLWQVRQRQSPGLSAQIAIAMLSAAILLIEPLRADSPAILTGIRSWQIMGWVGVVGTLSVITLRAPTT